MSKKKINSNTILPDGVRNTLDDLANRLTRILDKLVVFVLESYDSTKDIKNQYSFKLFVNQKNAETYFKQQRKELRANFTIKDPVLEIGKYATTNDSNNSSIVKHTKTYANRAKKDPDEIIAYIVLRTVYVEDGSEF